MFVGRLSGRGVFDPAGDRIGKVRDILVVERASAPPRVVGVIVEISGRKRVFVSIRRVTSIGAGQVITTGLINVRRFEQRSGETRVIAELIGRTVRLRDGSGTAIVEDAGIERTRSGEWIVSQLFVRKTRPGSPLRRGESATVRWADIASEHVPGSERSSDLLIQTLVDLKAADLAEALLELPPQRMAEVLLGLPDERVADAIEEMTEQDQLKALALIGAERTADVLDRMEPDDAADLIGLLPAAEGEELLDLMEPEEAEDVRRLLVYEADTAGGLMNPTPIILSPEASIAEGLAMIRPKDLDPAMASAIFVTHPPHETPTGEYLGMAHFQRMLRVPPHERIGSVADSEFEPLHERTSAAEVARRLASYNLVSLPVVNDDGCLVGVVTIDDVLDYLLPDDWRHTEDEEVG